jgi:hypothetical protein
MGAPQPAAVRETGAVEPFDHETIRREQDRTRVPELIEVVMTLPAELDGWADALESLRLVHDHRAIDEFYAFLADSSRPEGARRLVGRALWAFDHILPLSQRRAWWHSGDEILRWFALGQMDRSEAAIVSAVAGDGSHTLQAVAVDTLEWGFEEEEFQAFKVAALFSNRADVRRAAAITVSGDEPLAAEPRLRELLFDNDAEAANAAAYALQYFTSLATLDHLRSAQGRVHDSIEWQRAESASFIEGRIETELERAPAHALVRLQRWCDAIAFVPEVAAAATAFSSVPPTAMGGIDPVADPAALEEMLDTATGSFRAKVERLRKSDWLAVPVDDRPSIARRLGPHPDPEVRMQAVSIFAKWNYRSELVRLLDDDNVTVRKIAMYYAREVEPSPEIARRALAAVSDTSGTAAREALETYVVHADREVAIPVLVDRARNDSRYHIRSHAIYQLTKLGADDEIDALMPLLGNPPVVNWCVHVALLSSDERHRADRNHLLALVEVDYLDVAVGAARALGD